MTDLETTTALPVLATPEMKTVAETRLLGQALAPFFKAGDLLILEDELGAGKTTFTQGLGAGLQVQQWVTPPTFIIARIHPVTPGSGLVPLVHVGVHRLWAGDDIESLDSDSAPEDFIVAVEWGKGKAKGIPPHTLMVEIAQPEVTLPPGFDFAGTPENASRVLTFRASAGARDLSGLLAAQEALVGQA